MGRLSHQGLRILKLFLQEVTFEFSGADVIKSTRMLSGTVYPILLRFEQDGLMESRWEEKDPHQLRRPRRRLYRLTGKGAAFARSALRQVSVNVMLSPLSESV